MQHHFRSVSVQNSYFIYFTVAQIFLCFFFSPNIAIDVFLYFIDAFFLMLWWVESLAPCLREFIAFLVLMLDYMP